MTRISSRPVPLHRSRHRRRGRGVRHGLGPGRSDADPTDDRDGGTAMR